MRSFIFGVVVCACAALFGCQQQSQHHDAPSLQSDVRSAPMRVMSFNIRYDNARDGDNQWSKRTDLVTGVIERHAPDLMGVQEALKHQLDFLDAAMPHHDWVGVGRNDGVASGEFAPIFYRRDRFELLYQDTFWLSDTPDVPGSTSWGNSIPRICTLARLRDRTTDTTLTVFNAHLDHQSAESREESIKAIMMVAALARQVGTTEPIIVMGDFNTDVAQPPMAMMTEGNPPLLVDTWGATHSIALANGTFNGFEGRADGARIDGILASPDLTIVGAEIITDHEHGRYPSDHFPVSAVLIIGDRAKADD